MDILLEDESAFDGRVFPKSKKNPIKEVSLEAGRLQGPTFTPGHIVKANVKNKKYPNTGPNN
jgi:hypothetical protein